MRNIKWSRCCFDQKENQKRISSEKKLMNCFNDEYLIWFRFTISSSMFGRLKLNFSMSSSLVHIQLVHQQHLGSENTNVSSTSTQLVQVLDIDSIILVSIKKSNHNRIEANKGNPLFHNQWEMHFLCNRNNAHECDHCWVRVRIVSMA